MAWKQSLSIRWQLMMAMVLVSTIAILLAGGVLLVQEVTVFRQSLVREVTVLADVLGQNSAAALSFMDDTAAGQILGALESEPHIIAAALYGGENELFAEYRRDGAVGDAPRRPGANGHQFTQDRLTLFRSVTLKGKQVGTIFIQTDLRGMYDRIKSYGVTIGLTLLGSILVTFVISIGLQRLISGPILALAAIARDIRETKDYSVRAKQRGRNETGQLTKAFNQMLSEIETQQRALQQANESLTSQAGEILNSVDVLSSSAQDLSALSAQLATSASESAAATMQTTTTVEEVRQTAELASRSAQEVADTAQKTSDITQVGKQATEETIEGMERIRQQMNSMGNSMVHLSEQSQAIGQIVATVEDLAVQSNLLAVNAAIEAAHAGEHGKGFRAVAQQVRNLAEQSKQATAQVRDILTDIQKATSAAVIATEEGTKAVEAGAKRSVQAGDAIEALATSVSRSAQAAVQIATTSREQLTGVDQAVVAMASVKQASAQSAASARQLESSARNLDQLSQRLKGLANQ